VDLVGPSLELDSLERILRSDPAVSFERAIAALHEKLGSEYLAKLPHRRHLDVSLQSLERAYLAALSRAYGADAERYGLAGDDDFIEATATDVGSAGSAANTDGNGSGEKQRSQQQHTPPDPHKGVFDPLTQRYYASPRKPTSDADARADHANSDPARVMSLDMEEYLGRYQRPASSSPSEPEPPTTVSAPKVDSTTAAVMQAAESAPPTAIDDFNSEYTSIVDPPASDDPDAYVGNGGSSRHKDAWKPITRPAPTDGQPLPISHLKPEQTITAQHFQTLSEYPGPRVYQVLIPSVYDHISPLPSISISISISISLQVDNFLSESEVAEVMAYVHSQIDRFNNRSETGIALEMRADETPLLKAIFDRQTRLLGVRTQEIVDYFRVRRYVDLFLSRGASSLFEL
jgi:hypothetical protein